MKKFIRLLFSMAVCACLLMASCKKEHTHEFSEWQTSIVTTCTTDGEEYRNCSCGEVETRTVKATGHHEDENSCAEPVLCVDCGARIKDKSDHHKFTEWQVTKEPTCTTTGSRTHTCTVCNITRSEIINALNHNYSEWQVTKEPTCSSFGEQRRVCSNCKEVLKESIAKLPHNYDEWQVTKEPSCIYEGTKRHICLECSAIETEAIPMVDHKFGEWQITKEISCDHYGVSERKCNNCDLVEEKNDGIKDHNYENNVCTKCGHSREVNVKLEEILNKINLVIDSSKGLDLPSSIDDVTITWKSLNPRVITNEGYIYVDAKGQNAVLVARVEENEVAIEKTFTLTIPTMDKNNVDYCWRTHYGKKIQDQTASNIALITSNYGGCQLLKYVSSNPDVISDTGIINQQIYEQTATITAYLLYNGIIGIYEREITILGFGEIQRAEKIREWVPGEVEKLLRGEIKTLPTTHEKYGGTISWFSYEPGVIAGNGIFVKPLTPKNFTIQCTIICGTITRELEFDLESVGGNTTRFEQIAEWMKGQIPSYIMGTKNFVNDDDSLNYQIRTNDGGVLNLIDGTTPLVDRSMLIDVTKNTWKNRYWGSGSLGTIYHPVLSQEILDKLLYTGYQLPNPQQILWITVHESGMPRANNDALLLAQVQMDTANGLRDRQASWNYQVDENKIYQSFEDEVICWHAGDGTNFVGNGNNSSIGIEMCINEDGNYDGAMHMDAKLIASLLHKYNLSLINVKRHFDWSGKICPNYMITQGRWLEFLNYVDKEYTAMSILKDAKVSWTVTTDDNDSTEEVLNTYFIKGGSTLWYSKAVRREVTLHITMTVEIDGETLTQSNDLVLLPN